MGMCKAPNDLIDQRGAVRRGSLNKRHPTLGQRTGPSSTQTRFYLLVLRILAYESSLGGGAANEVTIRANNTQKGDGVLTCESRLDKSCCDRAVEPLLGSTEHNVEPLVGAKTGSSGKRNWFGWAVDPQRAGLTLIAELTWSNLSLKGVLNKRK